jgi:hypothetical protein
MQLRLQAALESKSEHLCSNLLSLQWNDEQMGEGMLL